MNNNELVIDATSSEIKIALLEDKQLVELSKEKSNKKFAVGDIYLGKVKKIMSGLNAAFVDVGYERDAFLHYLDLGPQFRSLNDYVQLGLNSKGKLPGMHKFRTKPDIDKNGKIHEVLSPGQYVLVQVAKEPISTKGPRISSEISIAGRHIVLIPFSSRVSVSQKISSSEERKRLKKLIQSIKPQNYGVIIRTVAEGKRAALLDNELRNLIDKWETSLQQIYHLKPPAIVIDELNRTSALLRDILNNTFNNIYVNDKLVFDEVKQYIESIAPEKQKIVRYFNGRTPIFEHFNIDRQVKALFGKTVTFKDGAYLIIEHTEALHVIDVNSGNRSKKGDNQEANAIEVNIAAAAEISRQLRLRDMGGIIVVDFIDMHSPKNRKLLYGKMKEFMGQDRTKHNILHLSKFGLMQITRQRVRPEMHIETMESCPTCGGSGEISPSILFVDELENNLAYIVEKYGKCRLKIQLHPYIAAYLNKGLFSFTNKWRIKYSPFFKVVPVVSYTLLEYHFFDRDGEEIII